MPHNLSYANMNFQLVSKRFDAISLSSGAEILAFRIDSCEYTNNTLLYI